MPPPRDRALETRVVRLREDGEAFSGIARIIGTSRQRAFRIWRRRESELAAESTWAEEQAKLEGEA